MGDVHGGKEAEIRRPATRREMVPVTGLSHVISLSYSAWVPIPIRFRLMRPPQPLDSGAPRERTRNDQLS